MRLSDLLDAYKAIHQLRKFADEHAGEIDLHVRGEGAAVNPVAVLHGVIQGGGPTGVLAQDDLPACQRSQARLLPRR